MGIDATRQVVAYDQDSGIFASRLWWMLRWLGHDAVAVLDGGFAAWVDAGHPVSSASEPEIRREFTGTPRADFVAVIDDVEAAWNKGDIAWSTRGRPSGSAAASSRSIGWRATSRARAITST